MWKTWVQSLGWEDPLEKEMATHSSVLAWRIPATAEPGGLPSMGSHRVRHNLNDLAAAAVSLLEKSHGHRSLVGCSLWDSNESGTTERLTLTYSIYKLNKQGDNIQPRLTPFPILNQSFVPCRILAVSS